MNKTWTIAKFEMKTLLRGWFFRIFAGLMIIGIGIFNVALNLVESGAPWLYRALPASIPYANLIILNLGQAIVAVFLASEFLKQDKKNDTVEVIYARSMSNAEYILGKSLGILLVFFVLNIIILIEGIGLSFISNDGGRSMLSFFFYPLLISLPTLIFILGLSFFMMITTKNQAITFILLLGYIALSIFYLNHKFYHLADFIAYNVPMIHSTIGGFGNIFETVLHRSIFFFAGLALIFFTITQLDRLPQSGKLRFVPFILTFVFLAVAGIFTYKYISVKENNINFRKEILEINNQNIDKKKVYVTHCNIEFEHQANEMSATAELKYENRTKETIDTLIFNLNPSLKVSELKVNGKEIAFRRKLHLIKIPFSAKAGKKGEILFRYSGKINENTHFVDTDLDDYEDNFSLEIFRLRKRYAYLQDNFVCLTSESLWYPTAGVTYSSKQPAVYLPDFTQFSLKVKTEKGLTPVSQGQVLEVSETQTSFKPQFPLPKISLLIANYKKFSINVDDIEYNLYATKQNLYFEEYFGEINDSLPSLIRDLRNEYETFLGYSYKFKRFALAEVPVQFVLEKHKWSITSDAVQPEIIFFPEKGVTMEETDFRRRKNRETKRLKRENEEVTPQELQAGIFKRFIKGNFMATPNERYMFRNVVDRNTFSIFPQFFNFVTQVRSDHLPVINLALAAFLREQNVNQQGRFRWWRDGVSNDEKINMELKRESLEGLIKNGIVEQDEIENERNKFTLNDVILAKGEYLFSLFKVNYGNKQFKQVLDSVLNKNSHKTFNLREIEQAFAERFNDSIRTDIENWYKTKELPGYIIRKLENYKVLAGEYSKYQVRFEIANPENADGIVSVNVEMRQEQRRRRRRRNWDDLGNQGFSKEIYIPAKSAKSVGFVFTTEPAGMNIFTGISENLPNNIVHDFSSFNEQKKLKPFDTIIDIELFTSNIEKNEIIVDNEDDNFKYKQIINESYLKSIINKNKQQQYKYTGLRFWSPPNEWQAVLRSGFYGKYVRSAYYTKAGRGKRSAIWTAPLKTEGTYDVYCNIERIRMRWRRKKEKPDYNFKIHSNEGVEEVNLSDNEIESGWNYLGTFFFSPKNAKVELSNNSTGEMIFADAVKWVKSR